MQKHKRKKNHKGWHHIFLFKNSTSTSCEADSRKDIVLDGLGAKMSEQLSR